MDNFRILYLCNAVDEETKEKRHVQFNSPAATNKVFGLCKALQAQNLDIQVVSLGRGKQTGSKERFPVQHKSLFGFAIHYASFWHIPILTHLVGAISLALLVNQLTSGNRGRINVIAYNRLWYYLPALIIVKIRKCKVYLDLEDGDTTFRNPLKQIIGKIQRSLFDYFCHDGALLASQSLAIQVKTKNTMVCYGVTELTTNEKNNWNQRPIQIVFGGSLLFETGAQLLIDTISWLDEYHRELKGKICITITGYGEMSNALSLFSKTSGKEWINYLGEIDRKSYLDVINKAHVGLCLKLSTQEMGQTTFPSKILEYASNGLAIITTRVSDVPELLDDKSAVLLDEETPQHLASILINISDKSFDLKALGKNGQEKINSICNSYIVGNKIKDFVLKELN